MKEQEATKNHSSLLFQINGDYPVKFHERILYGTQFIAEFLSDKKTANDYNYEPSYKDVKNFFKDEDIDQLSPSRIACAQFILHYLQNLHPASSKTKETFRIFDIGCGRGNYYNYFSNIPAIKNLDYLGIDIKPRKEWKSLTNDACRFIEGKIDKDYTSEPLEAFIGQGVDLVFSQSALEHVENDLELLLYLKKKFPNVAQLHLVPAPISYCNYMQHGFRRYSYAMLKKMRKNSGLDFEIFPIGGSDCMRYYFNYYEDQLTRRHPLFDYLRKPDVNYTIESNFEDITKLTKGSYPVFYALLF